MFKKGKVYRTVGGKPARVLWVVSKKSKICPGSMLVLHGAYTEMETVVLHNATTGHFSDELTEYNLTECFYD